VGGLLKPGRIATFAVGVAISLLALGVPSAGAATIDVDTTADESSAANTTCSLREAVTSATTNSNLGEPDCEQGDAGINDTISLDPGTYTLTGAAGDDANVSGDLDFVGDGNIIFLSGTADVNGVPTTTIDANNVDRIIDIQLDAADPVGLFMSKVTLRNGNVGPGLDGGAVRIQDPDVFFQTNMVKVLNSDAGHYGGGIHFNGGDEDSTVNILQTELAGNTAGSEGGGLWVDQDYDGDFNVQHSSLTGNSADMGGAIYLQTRPDVVVGVDGVELRLLNSTLSGNTASQAGGAISFDAANSGTLLVNFSTIADNTSTPAGSGGGIATLGGQQDEQFVYIGQSIVANNKAGGASSNCAGPGNFQSAGYNIESTDSCGFDTTPPTTDLVNTNPQLAPLSAYPASALAPFGGAPPPGQLTTKTRALYVGSPAIDRIPRDPDSCVSAQSHDQRFVLRPAAPAGLCDVGAFEGSIPKPAAGPIVKCSGKKATKVGTAAKNKIVGTKKADVIAGLGGNDTIKGKGGKDIICGGGGKDKLIGGKGRDKLFGQAGRDILRGGPGRDKLKGGPGRDRQFQ
jgi:CSLREA domain-containing protein